MVYNFSAERFSLSTFAHKIKLTGGVSPEGSRKGFVIDTGGKPTACLSKSVTTCYSDFREFKATFFPISKKNSRSKMKKISNHNQIRKSLTSRKLRMCGT